VDLNGLTGQARTDLLKALLAEQVVGGFKQAISIEEGREPRLVVQKIVQLQRPRSKLMVPEDFKADA
jgi:hypothetical protein